MFRRSAGSQEALDVVPEARDALGGTCVLMEAIDGAGRSLGAGTQILLNVVQIDVHYYCFYILSQTTDFRNVKGVT